MIRWICNVLELFLLRDRFRGRPAKIWLSCVEKEMESYGLVNVDPLNRAEWRCVFDRRKASCYLNKNV